MLDPSQLDALRGRWQAQGWPIADALRPGLDRQRLQDLVAPLGLTLPEEALVWWGWHDGIDPVSDPVGAAFGPGRSVISLEEAIRYYLELREIAAEAAEDEGEDPEQAWPHSWFPVERSKGVIVIDTDVPPGAPSPIRAYYPDDPPPVEPHVASFGDLVGIWIDAIDDGAWKLDTHAGVWRYDPMRLEPTVAKLGLA